MKRTKLALVAFLVLSLMTLPLLAACGDGDEPQPKSDEQQVRELIIKGLEAWNEGDWRTVYEMCSPNYRQTASYEEFKDFCERASDAMASLYGTTKVELVGDVNVRVEGEWAYATSKLRLGNIVVDMAEPGEEDIFRKVAGKWWDVTEVPIDPGYNPADLP
jgi:hypothetical protein